MIQYGPFNEFNDEAGGNIDAPALLDYPLIADSEEYPDNVLTFELLNTAFTSQSQEYVEGNESQITASFDEAFFGESTSLDIQDGDSGTGTETETLVATYTDTDTGSALDTEVLEAGLTQTDLGVGTESTSTFIDIVPSAVDTATGVDTQTLQIEFAYWADTDTATGTDTETFAAAISDADIGSLTEEREDLQTPGHFDVAINTETQSLSVELLDTDSNATATETEALNIVETDTGSAVDTQVLTIELTTATDLGTGTETALLEAAYTTTDTTVTVTEAAELQADVIHTDAALAAELETISVALTDADSAIGLETEDLGRLESDQAIGSETQTVDAAIFDSDSASVLETELIPTSGFTTLDTDPYYAQVLLSNPLSYWRFAETSGNLVHDKQARAHGILYGPLETTAGLVAGENTAFEFTSFQRIELGDLYYNYDEFSLEFLAIAIDGPVFVKPGEIEVFSGFGTISFTIFNNTGDIAYYGEVGSTTGHFVWSITAGLARLFHNGVMVYEYVQSASDYDTSNTLIVGQGASGVLDDLAVYARGLLPIEALTHYYAAVLNQDYGTSVQAFRPLIHLPYTGTLEEYSEMFEPVVNGTPDYVEGPEKFLSIPVLAVNFNSESVEYDIGGLLEDLPTYSIGVSFQATTSGSTQLIMEAGWSLSLGATGSLVFNNGTESLPSIGNYGDGQWHTAIIVWDGTTTRMYVDGELDEVEVMDALTTSSTLTVGETGAVSHAFVTEYPLDAIQQAALAAIITHGRNDITTPNVEAFVLEDDGFKCFTYNVELVSA